MEVVDSDNFSSGTASNGSRTDDQQGAASALKVDSIVVVLLVSAWVVALG